MTRGGLSRSGAVLDVGLAVLLAGLGVLSGFSPDDVPHPGLPTAVLLGMAGASLAVRRLWPLSAFASSFVAMGAVALLFGSFSSGASILITLVATFSAVVYAGDLRLVVAILVAFTAVLNLGQPFGQTLVGVVFTVGVLGLVVAAGVAVRSWRERAVLSGERAVALEEERSVAAELAAEEERRRIARELHDILSHSLGVVMLQAGAAEQALDRDADRAREAIRATRATAQEAIYEMRTLVRTVRFDEPDGRSPQPTLVELAGLLDRTRGAGLPVELVTEGEPRAVPPAVQASLYRVAQEGLANVLKHAGGAPSVLALRYRPDEVEIEVANEGPGEAAPAGQGPGSRLGLVGIRERVRVFGGRVQAGPRAEGGWDLRAVFPLS